MSHDYYVFFVADGTGGHAFAVKRLAEHNAQRRARGAQIEAERGCRGGGERLHRCGN